MKLLYITNSRIPTTKANGFQIMKMCEAFARADIDVELWIPRRYNLIKDPMFHYYGMRETFGIRKIPVLDLIPLERIFGAFSNFVESISFALFALCRLSKNSFDLVYSRDQFFLFLFSAFLFLFSDKPFVYEMHVFPKRLRFHKKIWHRASRIVTITHGLKNLLVEQGISANKILVASDGVDLEVFNSVHKTKEDLKTEMSLPKENFLAGYVGKFKTLGMEKGIKTMIESLPFLGNEIKIVFVGGEDSEIKEYKNLASRLNVLNQCVFFGYQPYLNIVKYMRALDALVIPFPNYPHYAFYASPLKLFEYMASGRPIIASDLPALREVLNDKNALFFKPENAEDFAKKVKMLKASRMLGYHLSQQALADVKQYSWEKRAKKILEFIRN